MDKTNNRNENEKVWRIRLAQAAEYPGSIREFCQAEGISTNAFQYWKSKVARNQAEQGIAQKPFARVEVERPAIEAQYISGLPDPRWLAEFILHLQRVNR